ncbi:lactadherin-like [Oculina patagonica]
MGRLNGETGWCQATSTISNDYLQVDMGAVRTICAVATQGKKNGSYVTSYKLSLSTDGVNWNTYQEGNTDKVFQANTDLNTIVQHTLNNAAQARYVRFYPVTRYNHPCMRIEVFVK